MRREKVGWTGYFTAAVWAELGIPDAAPFITRRGKFLSWLVRRGGGVLGLRGSYSVTNLFLAPRYLGLNALLAKVQTTQIIELAAGFSPRGSHWLQHNAGVYIEVDQPSVIAAKQKMFSQHPTSSPRPLLVAADLRQHGWQTRLLPLVDCTVPTLIICEGLTGYLNEKNLASLLQSMHEFAAHFEQVRLWLDFYLRLELAKHGRVAWAMLPAQLLWKLGRAPMRMFLRDAAHLNQVLRANGFEVQRLWSSVELAELVAISPPALALFYLAEVCPR